MRIALAVILATLAVSAVGGASAAAPVGVVKFDATRAHVYAGGSSSLLAGAHGESAGALARSFLRQHGVSAATADSLRVVSEHSAYGVTHTRMEQRVGGLRVDGAYVLAAVNGRGALVHLIENVVDLGGGTVEAAVRPEDALAATLARVDPAVSVRPAVVSRGALVTRFAKTAAFHQAPSAERVLLAGTDGRLHEGYVVQTWTEAGNALRETQVLGDGHVAASALRTANDSYNVFVEDPLKDSQTVVSGPGAGNDQSPIGWLSPVTQKTTNIVGNNVNAYLDVDANNRADKGGTIVTNGNFLTAANLALSPATSSNREVAVQNLFFLNNVIHDRLYKHGFDEAAGNFQANNFGKGGLGGDSVNAEAQDGSGTSNANFATPADGKNPRMQMYLWTGAGFTHQVVVGGTTYGAFGADFGKPTFSITGAVELVNDGAGTGTDACEALPARSLNAKIALVDRGTCNFTVKVKNAQNAGAIGVIVGNNVAGAPFTMGGTDKTIKIAAVMVSQDDRNALVAQLPTAATMKSIAPPLQIDGDLDSDVVFHEYGHGLTWRMIGGMDGPLAGAIGEGASDGLAMLVNGDDKIGEYAGSNPLGIRRFPYAGYPLTYGNVTGAEAHDDGEIYAAIVWRLIERFTAAGMLDDLIDTYIDGMNYTPSTPAYEDMRDGMLQSVAARGASAQTCLIWSAFAQYGVGVGADGVVSGNAVTITESFALPAECQ